MTRPNSIRAVGLRKHLDDTADIHGGKGYDDLVSFIESSDSFGVPIPITGLAKAFGVQRLTMEKWINIYREESGHGSRTNK